MPMPPRRVARAEPPPNSPGPETPAHERAAVVDRYGVPMSAATNPARARMLLKLGRAKLHSRRPRFTIMMVDLVYDPETGRARLVEPGPEVRLRPDIRGEETTPDETDGSQ